MQSMLARAMRVARTTTAMVALAAGGPALASEAGPAASPPPESGDSGATPREPSLLDRRAARERAARSNRSLITPHNRNYLLPVTLLEDPNAQPFEFASAEGSDEEPLQHVESKFQLSLKVAVWDGLLTGADQLYFAFTSTSYWQAFNSDISAPFRETNYEPELFWTTPIGWEPFGAHGSVFALGFSHQSNGRGVPLSRSWNRVYATLILDLGRWVVALKPWWRVPEERKDDPLEAEGDDNPDIDRFLGHFELGGVYRGRGHEYGVLLRNNLRSDNRGAVQLDWSFPLGARLRGYVQYFDGYGESLIDYDHHVRRFGAGILLTDLL